MTDLEKLSHLLTSPYEFNLVKKLAEFDEVIIKTKNDLTPHLISRYLFELSSLTNAYYAHVKILKSMPGDPGSEEDMKSARVFLLHKTREILKKGMSLIGIPFLERM
jgi:arginyl-tRNA synthetase